MNPARAYYGQKGKGKMVKIAKKLVLTATGKVKADMVITGGRLVNVYSGEILNWQVAVKDAFIAYVGENAAHTMGPKTRIIKAEGRYLVPGFIDAHTHIDWYLTPTEFIKGFIKHGTTALFAEPAEFVSALGFAGFKLFLREVKAAPIKVFTSIPMCSLQDPAFCTSRELSYREVKEALSWENVEGLGEMVSWPRILDLDKDYFGKIGLALAAKKKIEGHTSGAHDWKIAAQVAAGVSSCHESVQASDVAERLRLGLWTMLRYGGVRDDLSRTLAPLVSGSLDTRRAVLVSDSVDPVDLEKEGHMDAVVRRAIGQGLDPIKAIQMVTLNAAEHFGREDRIGGLAPGRYADILLLKDLHQVEVEAVISNGKLIFQRGKPLIPIKPFPYPHYAFNTVKLPQEFAAQKLKIEKSGASARVRAMELISESISRERIEELPVVNGAIQPVPEKDVLKLAVIDRHFNKARTCVGFIKGFQSKLGATATSMSFDDNNIVVVGRNDADMALAVNTIKKWQGGLVLVDQGKVVEGLPLPLAGTCSLKPARYVAEMLIRINERLKNSGCPFQRPINALIFVTFVTLPRLKMTDRGLVDTKNRRFVPLLVE